MRQKTMDWLSLAESLGKQLAARDTEADESDLFVADNIARLKSVGLMAAGVPIELGGYQSGGRIFGYGSQSIRQWGSCWRSVND
jgi:hypothetical protein